MRLKNEPRKLPAGYFSNLKLRSSGIGSKQCVSCFPEHHESISRVLNTLKHEEVVFVRT